MPHEQSGKSFRSFLGLPDSKPTPNDTVLIIIDAQNEYDHGLLAIHEVDKSRKVIGQVLQKWRDGKGDVVHILHETPEGAPLFTPGTELEREFEEFGVREGEEAHVCISATSRIGAEMGYDVSVISDAIGDRDIPGAKAGQLVTLLNQPTLFYLLSLVNLSLATRCNRDNCLRALAATATKASSFCATYTQTPQTATTVPTYASFCGNSPARASSACSCIVTPIPTASPTCVPTPVIKGSIGNGNFENYPPPGQDVFNIQPPWYFNSRDAINAYGDFKTEPSGPGFGGTVA
ncbi:MAG: hypothetical protein Q9186_004166 [Xanthomendoza sp. 1 TL-2023]